MGHEEQVWAPVKLIKVIQVKQEVKLNQTHKEQEFQNKTGNTIR